MQNLDKKVVTSEPNNKRKFSTRLQLFSTWGALAILVVFFSITSDKFLTVDNLLTVALQTSIIAIIAMGQTYVIITGGIDLSIGSNIALGGVVAALLMANGFSIPVSIVIALLVGLFVGTLNGTLIAYGKIPPFIVTLGAMSIIRGTAYVLTGGIPITNVPLEFSTFGMGRILKIPVPVIIMVILIAIFGFILAKTKLGRYIYAVGSNREAARLAGINIPTVLIAVYAISGFLAVWAGIIVAGRIISGQPAAGMGYELDAVAASVIGGASLFGGEGTILGTIAGAFVMGVLRNGLNLLNVSAFWQQIIIGAVIIGAVFLDTIRRR
ncbi:ABC transporter permease [Caldanaerobacter subterraneus]|uniref:ABC transporter permease n=1 Tax=Caldanaerobacter subterraneus TaxID=911092 RepID=UPI0032BFE3A3